MPAMDMDPIIKMFADTPICIWKDTHDSANEEAKFMGKNEWKWLEIPSTGKQFKRKYLWTVQFVMS